MKLNMRSTYSFDKIALLFSRVSIYLLLFVVAVPHSTWAAGKKKKCATPLKNEISDSEAPQMNQGESAAQISARLFSEVEALKRHTVLRGVSHPRSQALSSAAQMGVVETLFNNAFSAYKTVHNEKLKIYDRGLRNGVQFEEYKNLENLVLSALEKLKSSPHPKANSVFAAIETLNSLQTIFSLVKIEDVNGDGERNAQDQSNLLKKNNQKNPDEDKDEDEEEDDPPPARKKPSDQFPVSNDDLSGMSGKPKKPAYIYGTDAPAPASVLREEIFDIPKEEMQKSPGLRRPKKMILPGYQGDDRSKKLIVTLYHGENQVIVPTAYGYSPVVTRYADYEVVEVLPDEYIVRSLNGQPLPKSFTLWYEPAGSESLSAEQVRFYTMQSGIPKSEWPDHVLQGVDIAKQLGQGDPLKVIQALERWFRKDGPYVYFSSDGIEKNEFYRIKQAFEQLKGHPNFAAELARLKVFQCDGASLIAATVLRDFLGLPTRIGAGRTITGSKNINDVLFNLVDGHDPLHAWVEVYVNGEWQPFDFQPSKNNPQGKPKKEKLQPPNDPRREQNKESSQKQDESQNGEEGEPSSSESKSDGDSQTKSQESESSSDSRSVRTGERIRGQEQKVKDQKDQLEQTKAKVDQAESDNRGEKDKIEDQRSTNSNSQGAGKNDQKRKTKNDQKKSSDNSSPSDEGDFTDATKITKDKFWDRINSNYKSMEAAALRAVVSSTLEEAFYKTRLSEVKASIQSKLSSVGKELVGLAQSMIFEVDAVLSLMYESDEQTLNQVVATAKTHIYSNPDLTYRQLQFVKQYIEILAKYRELRPDEKQFLNAIEHILNEMRKIKHPNSSRHELIQRVFRDLPGHLTKEMLLREYPEALTLGSNDQNNLFEALRSGEKAGVLQTSLVRKHFNFVLDAEKEYRMRRVKTILRSNLRSRESQDLVQADVNDIVRFDQWIIDPELREDPASTLFSRLQRGEQLMRGNRQMMPYPGSHKPLERKFSVLFYDVSTSMGGDKARIQASAIAAYLDMAMSERDLLGQSLHRVMICPFGSNVGRCLLIENPEQAVPILNSFIATSTEADGGTEIQPVFDKFRDLVHQYAPSKAGERGMDRLKLKRVNMILMTDGMSNSMINYEQIKKDWENFPKDIHFMVNLISIDEHNAELGQLAQLTNGTNSRAMAHHLDQRKINQFINDSSNPSIDPDAFAADSRRAIPSELMRLISNLNMPSFSAETDWSLLRDKMSLVNEDMSAREAKSPSFFFRMTRLAAEPVIRSERPEVRMRFCADVYAHFEEWAGVSLNSLSATEVARMKQFEYWCTRSDLSPTKPNASE